MASPAKKTAEEREDTDYDPGTSGSEAGTPKKGHKKKEKPDPGLTLGTDIEDHLKPDGRQVEVDVMKSTELSRAELSLPADRDRRARVNRISRYVE